MTWRRAVSGTAALALAVAGVSAQIVRPRAELTPVVESTDIKPGTTVKVSLKVRLPKDVHVQSNTPRDPSLIPTVLTIAKSEGVTVGLITYPLAAELQQRGRLEKLAVYGPEFEIKVELTIADTTAAGDLKVAGELRYQACNDTTCFAPAKAAAEWILPVKSGSS